MARDERLRRNEQLLKELNIRIADRTADFEATGFAASTPVALFCTCADPACTARILLTPDEYEPIRDAPNKFLVAPGHDDPELERVVERHESYLVVEKRGDAG